MRGRARLAPPRRTIVVRPTTKVRAPLPLDTQPQTLKCRIKLRAAKACWQETELVRTRDAGLLMHEWGVGGWRAEHLFELVQQLAARHNMSDKCGAFCFDWDPQTGRRKNIYVTESLSEILGSHTEELLARVGSREHQAPHSELEFLSRLFSEFLGPHDCSSVLMGKDGNMHYMDSYTRIIVCDPKTRKLKKAFLARAVGIRELDAESNVFRTINLIDPVSVEQFEGRRRDILLDDDRDGQDLLADASKDYLFDESLDRLKNDSSKVSTVIRVIQQKTLRLKAIVRDLELRMLAHDGEGASLLVGGHGTGEGQAAFEAGQPSRGPGGSSSDAS
jgi:hypothetical protein